MNEITVRVMPKLKPVIRAPRWTGMESALKQNQRAVIIAATSPIIRIARIDARRGLCRSSLNPSKSEISKFSRAVSICRRVIRCQIPCLP